MIKASKILFINIFLFSIFFLIIELIFGYWFDKDNLGPYFREHRMKKVSYSINYESKKYDFIYKRNYYGFRGEEIDPKDIKAVFLGGSTADERYKPENQTITGYLNEFLRKKNSSLKIINAGIEGQSTRGHLFNLNYWFPRLPNFKPEIIIFYIGINDQFISTKKESEITHDGMVFNNDAKQRFYENLRSRSIFYDLVRKIKHKYYSSDKKKLFYDFDHSIKEYQKSKMFKNLNFLSYDEYIKINNKKKISEKYINTSNFFLERVDKLYNETKKFGSTPIFINQLDARGYNNKALVSLNISLINHCLEKKYLCIDMASKLKGKKDFWWDGVHTTPKGSKAIAEIIGPQLISFFEN